ncbi:MAG: enoyl-CoA hydratase/isomerase family protein [Halobacteriales archaeon]
MSDTVQSDVTGRVAEVTIDRPDKLNALTTETNTALRERFEALEHRDIDVVILKSAGDRAFVAGADINEISDLTTREFIDFQRNGRETNDTIASHPAIVIAAVNGIAFGGGFELALASDMIVAGEGASFATPEVQIGLVPGGGATQRLPEVVGPNKAKELLTTGDPITAAEGEDLGLVNRVVDDDSVEEEARDLAGDIVGNAPLAIREAKTLVDEGQNMPLPEGLSYEQSVTFTLFESDDVTEGIASFVEDRDPEFAGQ